MPVWFEVGTEISDTRYPRRHGINFLSNRTFDLFAQILGATKCRSERTFHVVGELARESLGFGIAGRILKEG